MHADGKSTLASVSKWNSGKVNLDSKIVSELFWKNLFSFSRYRPLKSGTSAGSILGFTRFSKIIIGKPSSVTSQGMYLPDQYRAKYLT